MEVTRIGSLFSGYEGLTIAVQAVLGGTTAWVSDIDPGANKILAHHYPDVPNLGDITAVDWDSVEPVDIITGGFPCTDVSAAGKRAGLHSGTRSGLFAKMMDAVAVLRPSLVVIENVRGLLTSRGDEATPELIAAERESDRCARVCKLLASKLEKAYRDGRTEYIHRHAAARDRYLGRLRRAVAAAKRADARIIRAIGTVLGSLADVGYDAAWYGLTASSVGAPHGRFRVFIIAWPATDTNSVGHERVGSAWRWRDGSTDDRSQPADADRAGLAVREGVPCDSRAERPAVERGDRPFTADAGSDQPERRRGLLDVGGTEVADQKASGQRKWVRDAVVDSGAVTADAIGGGFAGRTRDEIGGTVGRTPATRRGQDPAADSESGCRPDQPLGGNAPGLPLGAVVGPSGGDRAGNPATRVRQLGEPAPVVAWGQFEPAIRRWEHLTRPAPAPTETGAKGGQRLSPRFVEWMQGLPDGHVTAPEIGLTRNEQLKALGNGVVVQQAEAALRYLLSAVAA